MEGEEGGGGDRGARSACEGWRIPTTAPLTNPILPPPSHALALSPSQLKFLTTFLFKRHPGYAGRPLYITGESYAGHYVPELAAAVLAHNERTREVDARINLEVRGRPLFRRRGEHIYAPLPPSASHGL